jgi:hypothetical protein
MSEAAAAANAKTLVELKKRRDEAALREKLTEKKARNERIFSNLEQLFKAQQANNPRTAFDKSKAAQAILARMREENAKESGSTSTRRG